MFNCRGRITVNSNPSRYIACTSATSDARLNPCTNYVRYVRGANRVAGPVRGIDLGHKVGANKFRGIFDTDHGMGMSERFGSINVEG